MDRKTNALHLILRFFLISLIVAGFFAFLYFSTTRLDQYTSTTFIVKPRIIFTLSIGFIMGLFFSKDIIIQHIRHRHTRKTIEWNHLFAFLNLVIIIILFLTSWNIRRLILSISSTFNPLLLIPMLLGYFLPRIWKEDIL